ncbi:zinc finger FYVE-type containing 26 spastizin [Xylocopa sonorina]|uniref:zinc finger FYVE-type containing 26 spastizin n=1 Tax=Xylocopa sonorina TaxID=1818115 RepID=UPI00403AED61
MSKETEMLQINKCILSKLWYTSLTVSQENDDNSLLSQCNNDTINFLKSEALFTDITRSPDEKHHQWIINILLRKVLNDVASDTEYLEKQQVSVQVIYALQFYKNLAVQLQQELLTMCKSILEHEKLELFEKTLNKYFLFLKQNITNEYNPIVTCWILNELLLICSNTSSDIHALQDFYSLLMKVLLEFKLPKQITLSDNVFGYILCIISKMDVTKFDESALLIWLFPMILKTSDTQDMELALYCRKDEHLFKKWCAFLNEVHVHFKSFNNLTDALKIQKVLFNFSSICTPTVNKNKLIERINSIKVHWVIDILDICYTLTINGKHDDVSLLLSYPLLTVFWPALLFQVLNSFSQEYLLYDVDKDYDFLYNSIEFLIHKCNTNVLCDPTWNALKNVLAKHVKSLKYILHCVRDDIKMENFNHWRISIKYIFDLLQNFDSLLVLKMTTNIHEQEHKKIKSLLEDLSEPESILNAYYSMLCALKAILLCDKYDTKQSTITSYFSDMNHYVKLLHPFDLRIQIIENIFSLLFLRHEDFQHTEKPYDNNDMDISYEQLEFENKWIKQHLVGFICNKYAVRDMLFHLKDIISATEIEYMKLENKNEEKDQIQKAIASVIAAITNARWRLELYTTPDFVENVNSRDGYESCLSMFNAKILLDTGKLISNRFKENTYFYQEGNISDETKIRSCSESELVHNTKWRKRSKNMALTTDGITTKDITHKPLFVNLMLATEESLIIRCLWKNDYTKAQEILEAFDMKNTQLNGEVQFSKALHIFRKNISKYANTLKSENESAENIQSSTLKNIRLVAQESIQSSRQTSQFETFLASQEVNLRMLFINILNNYEMLTICVLDLAITMSQTCPISQNLCEVAMKYLKTCKTFESTEYVHFFQKCYQLFYEKKEKISIEHILCDAKNALSIKECKEKEEFWTNIAVKHCEFKESQLNKNTINKILKDSNYLPGLKILNKIVTVLYENKKYMQNICSHLQLLHSIIPTEHTILTVSDLLKISLHYYFGHQIFELEVEPNKLEAIAHDLQINLAYSILTTAYPVRSYKENTSYTTISKESGCIILNKASCKVDLSYKIQGPNQCVSEILAEVLQILHNLNLSQSRLTRDVCKSISKHSAIQNILNKTSCLLSLDLSELSMGNETLSFLLNLWNLMFLHATLTIWANHSPFNNLQHVISLMSIGYLIGDLGLVTLASLRSKLLNNMMLNDTFFVQVEELNEPAWQDLDIIFDPRVIFAMANEFFETPYIRICNADSLNEDLTNAFTEYLEHYSSSCEKPTQSTEKQKLILLPEIAERYETFISQNLRTNLQAGSNNNDIVSISDYFKSTDETIIVQYIRWTYSYSIVLKYSNNSNVHHHKQINQHKSSLKTYSMTSTLLQYLEGQCWIVSYLLQRIHNVNPTILEKNYDNLKRTAGLENLVTSSWVNELKSLFENNQTFAAIIETIPIQRLWSHFELLLKKDEWDTCLKLINALPSCVTLSTELQCFKDKVLNYIVSKRHTTLLNTEILQYLYQIKDIHILSQTVLYNINRWHVNICENALLYTVHHMDNYKLPIHCKLQLNEVLHRVQIFRKMLPYCVIKSNGTWYDIAYCTEKVEPLQIIKSLMNSDKFELCLEWMECQAFSLELHPLVTQEFLIGLLKSEPQNYAQTLKFLQALPLDQSVKLCKTVLKKLESIDSLTFICNYLSEYCKATETIKYRRTLLGIDILSMLDVHERPLYIHLIKEPLLMLEQLLMNCKFESIQKILSRIENKLDQVDISRNSFDKVIRFYAQKSLDCRVSLQCDITESKSRNVQHSTSEAESTEFVMPILVPSKEEWVPNDKARKCSCCKNVIFSMFNRRHHCRRCGRVICATCSQHRIQVPGYPPSVLVRVCDDCKQQTVLQMHASTPSSEVFDCWRLTKDQRHNKTTREEFSFEYAPNISLCLAILNLHSEHETYTSFLLDCCDEMKRLLQPVSGGKVNPEVDHAVIIKMIRSLLVTAKVKCAKLGLNTGLVHCDRFLSHVDLIANLVQFDCVHLIPSDNLGKRTLRKLRDLLIEKEQWTLALDVSTKAGLDTQGVWVTWGKACLKMGYFDQAREKFFHCLEKIQYENFDDWVVISKSYPKEPETSTKRDTQKLVNEMNETKEVKVDELSTKKLEFSKNRPLKDPPLLVEILQILDNLSIYKQCAPYSHQYKSSASQEILSNFGSFKIVNQKQFNVKNASTMVQNIYYHESLYYLLTYASYNSILEFFLRYEEFDKCLTFTLEHNLEPEQFFNAIYLYCLKNGNIEKLHEAMMNKDPSLLIWKVYLIYTCHSLEKRQYLNILYHLQLFMKDSVRAAMTCIRFYLNEVRNYTDLNGRTKFLLDAQKHLESELQIEILNRKRRKSTSSMHSNQGILTMEMEPSEIDKHINTICRQMEITKFLANCEKEERAPIQFLMLFPGKDLSDTIISEIPTLFGDQQEKIDLAVLAILCGRNIEEGFGIAFRIMQDYNLPQQKVYSLAGHILILKNNIFGIEQLIKCCRTSGIPNSSIISDYVITHCVKLLLSRLHNEDELILKNDIYNLVRLIIDIELKINAYIECKQLKAAYLLAVKHSRAQDIRKILKESDRLGQNAIKAICIKWLQQEPKL